MKKFFTILIMLVLMVSMVQATMTNTISSMPTTYWQNQKATKYLWLWAQEVEGDLGSGLYLQLTPTTEPTGAEGMIYYDDAANTIKFYTGAAWTTLASAAGNSLDTSYDAGTSITVDGDAVTLTAPAASANEVLALVQANTGNYSALSVTNASVYPSIQITGTSTGNDITGTSDLWTVSEAGVGAFVGVIVGATDIVMENGGKIENSTDSELLFAEASEDFSVNFATSNTLTLSSTSGVDTIAFGALDAFTGVASIAGDTGADFALSAANTGTFNFTIAQAGTGDNELRLTSAGTAANAIALTASAGGITATAVDDIIMTVASTTTADDLTLQQTGAVDAGINLLAAGTAADAILLSASAGGVTLTATGAASGDIIGTAVDDISLTATDDLTLNGGSAGSIINLGTNTHGNVIHIGDNDTAADAITIGSAKDTTILAGIATTVGSTGTTSATVLQSGTGDLALTSTDQITLTVNTAVTDNIKLVNSQSTDVDAIALTATAGGLTITTAGVASAWTQTANGAADDLTIALAGAVDSSIILTTAGTGEDALSLLATGTSASANSILMDTADGGVIIRADGAAKGDITLDAEDDVIITSTGVVTINSALAGTNHSGPMWQTGRLAKVVTTGSLTSANCGFVNQVAVDAQTITLPATVAGLSFTIMNTAAAGASILTLELDNADKFIGAGILSTGAALTPADGEALVLTKNSSLYGDYIVVTAHVDGWIVTEQVGIWAEASP